MRTCNASQPGKRKCYIAARIKLTTLSSTRHQLKYGVNPDQDRQSTIDLTQILSVVGITSSYQFNEKYFICTMLCGMLYTTLGYTLFVNFLTPEHEKELTSSSCFRSSSCFWSLIREKAY